VLRTSSCRSWWYHEGQGKASTVSSGYLEHCTVLSAVIVGHVATFSPLERRPASSTRAGVLVYPPGIYTHTPEQLEEATKYVEAKKGSSKAPIYTELEPVAKYYKAEDYHQQYLARGGRNGKAQNPAKGCTDPIR